MAPNKTLAARTGNELRECCRTTRLVLRLLLTTSRGVHRADDTIEEGWRSTTTSSGARHSAPPPLLSRRDDGGGRLGVDASAAWAPQSYLDRSRVELRVGSEVPRDGLLRLLVDVSTTAMTYRSPAAFRVAATRSDHPVLRGLAVRIESLGRRDHRRCTTSPTDRRRRPQGWIRCGSSRPPTTSPDRADESGDLDHRGGTRRKQLVTRAAGQAAGGPAAADAHRPTSR